MLVAALTACKSDSGARGGISGIAVPVTVESLPPNAEPGIPRAADRGALKVYEAGRRAVLRRDFARARDLFQDAVRRHRASGVEGGDFVDGCDYYFGRCMEGILEFDDARVQYEKIPVNSPFRPYALRRIIALSKDSDGDGYIDAWEEAEGANPFNPLSHP